MRKVAGYVFFWSQFWQCQDLESTCFYNCSLRLSSFIDCYGFKGEVDDFVGCFGWWLNFWQPPKPSWLSSGLQYTFKIYFMITTLKSLSNFGWAGLEKFSNLSLGANGHWWDLMRAGISQDSTGKKPRKSRFSQTNWFYLVGECESKPPRPWGVRQVASTHLAASQWSSDWPWLPDQVHRVHKLYQSLVQCGIYTRLLTKVVWRHQVHQEGVRYFPKSHISTGL